MNKEGYYLINVPGKDGYSFIVQGNFKDADEAIEQAQQAELFYDSSDADKATAEIADDYDIRHFYECGSVFEIEL